jgi:hypothetical protein
MKIQRIISLFDKQKGSLIKEIDISYVSTEVLITIFGMHKDDPLLHGVYSVNKKKLKKLNFFLKEPIQKDTDNVIYTLDSFQL